MYFPSNVHPSAFAFGSPPQYVAMNALPGAFTRPAPPPFSQPFVPNTLPLPQYSAVMPHDVANGSASGVSSYTNGLVGRKTSLGNSAPTSPEGTMIAPPVPGGWGLSLASSPASSLTSQPYYYVIQQQMPFGQLPPVGCPPGIMLQSTSSSTVMAPHAARNSPQDNGSKYILGERYEGTVKRYNPMRGFGFLTATHRFRQVTPVGADDTDENPTSATATATATATDPEPATGAGGEASEGAKGGTFVREPVTVGDIFVHQSYIQMHGFRALTVGERVFFRVGVLHGKRAHQAVDVQRVEDVMKSCAATNGETCSGNHHVGSPAGGRLESPESVIEELLQVIGCGAGAGADGECIADFTLPSPFFDRSGGMDFADAGMDDVEQTMPPHNRTGDGDSSDDEIYNFMKRFEDK